ncbi:MAG: Npt1/Npt2 family nucleotide transporter [Candidatus Poribacteria bacterium]|nr:Npt1/Npt2 family nucleotide transporter [Candidatus Poribacteria bacterium]
MFPRRLIFAAIAISSAACFVLFGYEFIRSVSTSLFVDAYGAENLPRGMMAIPPSMIVLLYGYGRLLSWQGATRALVVTLLFSAALILWCYTALSRGMHFAAAIIYVFREAYIVIVIEQFWSFVNSVLTTEQAKRINGPFCAVASLGSFLGGTLVSQLATVLGTEALLLFTAGSLVPTAVLGVMAYRFGGEPKPSEEETGGRLGHIGIRTLFRSKYLVFIGVLIISTQVVSTVLDLRFNLLVELERPDKDMRTAFYGSVYGNLGLAAGILQLVVVPLALRFVALRYIHLVIPIVHFVSSLILTLSPSLRTGTAAYVIFKALDYSVFRAGKELFYMPLSYDSRYRAKQVIDSFGYRFSKGGSAGVIELVKLVVKTIPGIAFSITAMVAAMVWTPVVLSLTRAYQRLVNTEEV